MRTRLVDPLVNSMMEEANLLPDSAARNVLLERAACAAEALHDLDTAWKARCTILSSSATSDDPRFEALFMSLAWCLAVSDRDPDRFSPSRVLWQYKWVATAAPPYARVPRAVLDRLIEDMEVRFVRAGWGRRAILHKRIELHQALGELEAARALVEDWRAVPRDRGADCLACETDSMSILLADCGDARAAVREARPIIIGRLSCSTVPQSTFGHLLLPLITLGEHAQARELYDKGRRLVAAMDETGVKYIAPYLTGAVYFKDVSQALAILRARLKEAAAIKSDGDRLKWFGHAAVAMELLAASGVEEVEISDVPGLVRGPTAKANELASAFRSVALGHAQALDTRNGNSSNLTWLNTLGARWGASVTK